MNTKEKYIFDTDFQQEILQFTVTDPKSGYKALELFESENFTLIPHILIAEALKKYYQKKFIIPSLPVLREEVRQLLRRKQWAEKVHPDDKDKAIKVLKKIYLRPVKDADTIYKQTQMFARYTAFKEELENVDLDNFESYAEYAIKLNTAAHKGTDLNQRKSMLFLRDAKIRAVRRIDEPGGKPTPWRQLNALTNSGGTTKGSINIVLSEAKFFKTGFAINTAIGYVKMGDVVLYIDLENGEQALSTRADQAIMNKDRRSLLEPGNTQAFLKLIRKYKRFGGEMAIIRLPAGSTSKDMGKEVKRLWDEEGLKVTKMIVDYPDLAGATDGQSIEDKRISQVYIDLKNLAEEHDIDTIWCPSHVNREGTKEGKGKNYGHQHIAKASDKIRHADLVLAIIQDDEEQEAGIIRAELVAQRDGLQSGRIWFWANLAKQKLKEFNNLQIQGAEEQYKEKFAGKGKRKEKEEPYEKPKHAKNTADI